MHWLSRTSSKWNLNSSLLSLPLIAQNPDVPGSAGIVEIAEALSREASKHLLSGQNTTKTVKAEAESIGE